MTKFNECAHGIRLDAPCSLCTNTNLRRAQARNLVTGIEAEVCLDITRRQQTGIAKYGQTVADNPLELRAWMQHAYEECLDQAVYLRRAMHEMDTCAKPYLSPRAVWPFPVPQRD